MQCEALSDARVEEVSIALCPDASGNHKPLFGLDIGELKVRGNVLRRERMLRCIDWE